MTSNSTARIEQLDEIQKDVIGILTSAANVLAELSKERPIQKTTDGYATQVSFKVFRLL